MIGLIIAGASLLFFGGLYAAGVAEAQMDERRQGRWMPPPAPLPQARIRRR